MSPDRAVPLNSGWLSQLAAWTRGYPLPIADRAIPAPSRAVQNRIRWQMAAVPAVS